MPIDRRDRFRDKSRGIDTELLQEVAILVAIDVDLAGIRPVVIEAAGLAHRLGQGQGLDVERNLGIEAKDVLIERAERGEGRRFTGDEDHVVGPNEDILARIVHDPAQQNLHALAVTLQRDPAFDRLEFRSAGARDHRQHPLADAVERDHAGRVDVAQDADDARMLLSQLDDNLRLDGAVSQPGDDRLLNFGQGPCGGGNLAGVGNIDIALLIDRLRRQVDEVTGTRARRLGRRKQIRPARLRRSKRSERRQHR